MKDRRDERAGMKRYERSEGYAGYVGRMRKEWEDSRMLSEDHNAIANMPQDVKYHRWPFSPYDGYPHLDDTMSGIDYQMHQDNKKRKRETMPEKY